MALSNKPNIIFILTDQHNPFITGCYHDPVVRTPNIDKLAARGIVFDNAYTAAPVCVPARMSLLTGCYPHHQECWTNTDVLASDRPTYAHALGATGLHPKIVGRMHSLGPDQLRGFSERLVGDHSPNQVGGKSASLGDLVGTAGPGRKSVQVSGAGQSAYELHDRDVATECKRLADVWAEEKANGSTDPYFLHVGLMLPHQPYVADAELFDYYLERIPEPQIPAAQPEAEHAYQRIWKEAMNITTVDPEEIRRARAAYYALTETMDALVGSVLQKFEDNGLLENTLIVYCSDHGDQIGERGLWWKHSFYEQSVRVPVVMSWPGVIPEGERRSQIVNLVDLAPTFLDVVGGPEMPEIDGISMLPIAIDDTAPWINETFSEYCTDGQIPGMPTSVQQRMIRSGPWKLIYYEGFAPQLFNLDDDPLEQHDLSGDAKHASILAALTKKILAGWSPGQIAQTMDVRKARKALLKTWATQTNPEDRIRWKMNAEDNWLVDR